MREAEDDGEHFDDEMGYLARVLMSNILEWFVNTFSIYGYSENWIYEKVLFNYYYYYYLIELVRLFD